MSQISRDLIGGIFLVPALHFGFILLLLLLGTISGNTSILGVMFVMSFFWTGITQFVYLIPVGLVYWRRQRFEVVKGIAIGAVITILVNGACFLFISDI
jgi:hypothetical protein